MSSRGHQFREFEAEAQALGYLYVGKTARGHLKWRHSCGALVVTVSDMTQRRDRHNAIRDLRASQRRQPRRTPQQEASP